MINSLYSLLLKNASYKRNKTAVRFKYQNIWKNLSWNGLKKKCDIISRGLLAIGIGKKSHIAILSSTNIKWTIVDLAVSKLGSCIIPIYHSSLESDISYILNDAKVEFIFVDNKKQLEKIRSIRLNIQLLKKVICFKGGCVNPLDSFEIDWNLLLNFSSYYLYEKKAKKRETFVLEDDIVSIVYTSGTTGRPKGAMITCSNLIYEAKAIEITNFIRSKDVQLLFLPLAHIFAKVLEVAWLSTCHELCFAENFDKVVDNMLFIRPTIMAAVPRVFEKIYNKIKSKPINQSQIKTVLIKLTLYYTKWAAYSEIKKINKYSILWFILKKLVLNKIKRELNKKFGGKLRAFISGGAPLSPEITYFFKYSGIMICEGYGLTETTAATTLNLPNVIEVGSVGKPLRGTNVKIKKDGEIWIKGPGVFSGYWNKKKDTKTVLSSNGYFCSGDIGYLSSKGFLFITDRKKDLIVTSGGKNIAPQKIESLIKNSSSIISRALIFGDKKKFISALITIDKKYINILSEKSQKINVKKEVTKLILKINSFLPNFEQIKKFTVLDHNFTIGDQLTPSLKIKRAYCNIKYKKLLESFYE